MSVEALRTLRTIMGPRQALANAPPPPLWTPEGVSLLPARVLCIALHQPYAGLVVAGDKTLETRTWPWPYVPSWLAIYATLTPNRAAFRRLGALAEPHRAPLGAIVGLVWIGGYRPMVAADEARAFYPFERGLYVWSIGAAYRFQRPNTTYLARGPQKVIYLPREVIVAGLAGT
jgi:hypothetical protein